ncbi:MAG: type II toxin-antitoxin system RelE/ParE family toxin [Cyclobacteriaceae bacterium]|nr:type II toxin-antitoxin system RelE/ParE family toxin [Cyclobacteriaceae bacterium]
MPEHELLISRTAQKQLDKLTDNIAEPLIEAILNLAHDPRPHGCIKLKGRSGYRIRKGDYRIIYDVYDNILTVEVIALGHRKDIYD